MRHSSTGLRLVAATALLASPLLLSGCGDAIKNAVEKQVEDAAASDGVSVDVDLDDPNHIKVDSTDGGFTTGELPQDYPVSEVPVVDGTILAGTYTKNPSTWNVTIQVGEAGGDKNGPYDDGAGLLTGAGCEETVAKADNGTAIVGQYKCGDFEVYLATTDSNGVVVNYTVSAS